MQPGIHVVFFRREIDRSTRVNNQSENANSICRGFFFFLHKDTRARERNGCSECGKSWKRERSILWAKEQDEFPLMPPFILSPAPRPLAKINFLGAVSVHWIVERHGSGKENRISIAFNFSSPRSSSRFPIRLLDDRVKYKTHRASKVFPCPLTFTPFVSLISSDKGYLQLQIGRVLSSDGEPSVNF